MIGKLQEQTNENSEEEETKQGNRIGNVHRVVAVRVRCGYAARSLRAQEQPTKSAHCVGDVDLAVVVAVAAEENSFRRTRAGECELAGAVQLEVLAEAADEHVDPADVFGVELGEYLRRDAFFLVGREDEVLAEVVMLGPVGLGAIPGEDDRIDSDKNEVPDCLEHTAIPAESAWGLIILALLLAVGGRVGFRKRSVPET